jgi:hypothetical protein
VEFERTWERLRPERVAALAKAFPRPAERTAVGQPCDRPGQPDEGTCQRLAEALPPRARLAVELGARLGFTTRLLAERSPESVVVAVDYSCEGPQQRSQPDCHDTLPALSETVLALCWPYRERIIPLRMAALSGLQVLADYVLRPDLICISGERSYEATLSELALSKRLFPQAKLLGDNYPHPPVRDTVDEFAALHGLSVITRGSGWRCVNLAEVAGRAIPRPTV